MTLKRFFAVGVFGLIGVVLFATPASAQSGGCTATANGGPVTSYNTPANALKVDKSSSVQIQATAPGAGAYKVQLEFAGVKWTASSGTFDGTTWGDSVAVDDYASNGIGLYKVLSVSAGDWGSCSNVAFVKVGGAGPLSTNAGKAAGAVAVVGLALTVGGAVRAAKPIDVGGAVTNWMAGPESDVLDRPPAEDPAYTAEQRAKDELELEEGKRNFLEMLDDYHTAMSVCMPSVALALALTCRAMLSEGGQRVLASVGRIWR